MINKKRTSDCNIVRKLVLSGNLTFTLKSTTTDGLITFKISSSKDKKGINFVSVQFPTHDDFIGTIFDNFDTVFRYSYKSKISKESPYVLAFKWFFKNLLKDTIPDTIEFWY